MNDKERRNMRLRIASLAIRDNLEYLLNPCVGDEDNIEIYHSFIDFCTNLLHQILNDEKVDMTGLCEYGIDSIQVDTLPLRNTIKAKLKDEDCEVSLGCFICANPLMIQDGLFDDFSEKDINDVVSFLNELGYKTVFDRRCPNEQTADRL